MKNHHVRVHRSEENLERKDQLAWKLAEVAVDDVEVLPEVEEMIINLSLIHISEPTRPY